jgi:hypothetical protein
MILTWNRAAPELRQASRVDLVLHKGASPTIHSLDRPSGTLIIPFTPQSAALNIDGRKVALYGAEPEKPPPADLKSENPRTLPPRPVKIPMVLSNLGRKVVSTANVILPSVPAYVKRSIDIDLSVKVGPAGNVAGVASNYRHDPLRRKLSALASGVVSQWQFNRIAVISYREGKVRLVFTPQGVRVQPAPAG